MRFGYKKYKNIQIGDHVEQKNVKEEIDNNNTKKSNKREKREIEK